MTATVVIYVYNNVEVLDFAGPFEVFTTASRVFLRGNPEGRPPFRVVTAASVASAIQARAGLKVLPDFTLTTCPPADVLLVPGGVVDEELRNEQLLDWIRHCASRASITAAVCTGAFLLARAGLLQGKRVTTHWEDIADLQAQFPDITVQEDVRWVDAGSVVTSAGIAAGIDMSLHLVARLGGPELASSTARQMDVPFNDEC